MTYPVHVDCDNSPILTLMVMAMLGRGKLMCNALELAYAEGVMSSGVVAYALAQAVHCDLQRHYSVW